MPTVEDIPVAQAVTAHLVEAARLLEQALKAGAADPQAAYMLAMCYKGMGKTGEARGALRKIAQPDANVYLQLGLLSFAEKAFAQAEEEFAKSWELNRDSYAAAYDLLLARLCQGRAEESATMIPQILPLAPASEQRFLSLLQALLTSVLQVQALLTSGPPKSAAESDHANGSLGGEAVFAGMTDTEEERLVQTLANLGQFEVSYPLLRRLAVLRPESPTAQCAYLEAALVQAKALADRADWEKAKELLGPLGRLAATGAGERISRPLQIALLNLLGCCCCMLQDFDMGVWYFEAALKRGGSDAWLHQNMALAREWQGRLDQAETHWNRYFDLLDEHTPTPSSPRYLEALAFEGLNRLADLFSKKERWNAALGYLQRAHRIRPRDPDTLERLYHLYTQLKKPDEARRALRRLREVRPNDPQFDLYELDLREVRTLSDIERLLAEVRKILNRNPGDLRVEERALGTVNNVIPLMGRMADQLTDQANKVVDQMRRLPSYQINWPAVREVMRELEDEFGHLRRITTKCLQLVTGEDQRRVIRDLAGHIDRKIELCHSMGG